MIQKEKINGCDKRVLKLADWLEDYANEKYNTQIVITSGLRRGEPRRGKPGFSWHNIGKAIDFYFYESDVFEICSDLYSFYKNRLDPFKEATEFEIVRSGTINKYINHVHIAFGLEKVPEAFTGTY